MSMIDAIGLAEAGDEIDAGLVGYAKAPLASCVSFFYRGLRARSVMEHPRYSIVSVTSPLAREWLLVLAHLPSKRYADDRTQALHTRHLARPITRCEQERGHQRTILLGDLNANLFEPSVAAADGLHGVMTRAQASKRNRRVDYERYPYFYNPMWSLLGDANDGPPGTWYGGQGSLIEFFWHCLDQCLVRPDLLREFSGVWILDRVGGIELANRSRVIGGRELSDHLPVLVELNFQ